MVRRLLPRTTRLWIFAEAYPAQQTGSAFLQHDVPQSVRTNLQGDKRHA